MPVFECWTDTDPEPTRVDADAPDLAAKQFFEESVWDGDPEAGDVVRVKKSDGKVLGYCMGVAHVITARLMQDVCAKKEDI